MARGWESKAVESQIEAAESRRERAVKVADPAILERKRELESLEMARKRVLHQLSQSQDFRLEKMRRAALKHLDEKIAELK